MDGILIILESGVGIHFGGTPVTFGHMITGGIISLLLYVGHRLDREYSQFLTLESLEEKEQELHNL